MDRKKRIDLIRSIEEKCGSRLVVYITGDRRGLETKIATDVFPMFHRVLMQVGKRKRIDLFIYSTGGITIAGYALVNLLREFCDEFKMIIPFKALSTATLIALGADQIIMTPMAQLSPIDPSIEHPLGPVVQIPGQPGGRIAPVNVEDVNAFLDLAKNEIGLRDQDSMKKVLDHLASNIHPLLLGAVQRSREQIAFLASNLMKYHCTNENRVKAVVKTLIRERFSHDYIIGRREAKETLKLNIVEPDVELTQLIIDLFSVYNEFLEQNVQYNPETVLGAGKSGTFTFNRGIIESTDLTHVFKTDKEIRRVQVPQEGIPIPLIGYQERILREGWFEDNTI